MAEIDYQMALLLQHRFEQEYKAAKDAQRSDEELARHLQEQFEQEEAIEKPSSNLVYKKGSTANNTSRSLVDPSWELVDPTPEIHTLFMVFNERFFWNKLLAVCVRWSKRMTSCAGICAYDGRGGMCSITLSEPLLKLRPRKDLVETLLHEMIHAFLFVTHNNRDRDGHGPEFHKHMYRINKEAGTNITVYHNFYDEVRLYQQHWWRCNGPCQSRKPFFGMVRRASNRAPGPNDRWWAEHVQTCGGTFIKVKEPEKTQKKVQPKIVTNVKTKDIRSFMVPQGKSSNSSNVKGFKDLTNEVKGKYNSSSTIVVTKNTNVNKENTYKPKVLNPETSNTVNKKTGTNTNTTNVNTNTCYTNDFMSVRDHWANKFSNSQPNTTSKKRSMSPEPSTSCKVQRGSEPVPSAECCECPVCGRKMLIVELNSHLDTCLNEPSKSTDPEFVDEPEETKNDCPLCNSKVATSVFDVHVEKCLTKVYAGVEETLGKKSDSDTFSCLVCGRAIVKSDLSSHLDDCMVDIFHDGKSDEAEKEPDERDNEDRLTNSQFNCPFCMKLVDEDLMKSHLDDCLNVEKDDVLNSLMDDSF